MKKYLVIMICAGYLGICAMEPSRGLPEGFYLKNENKRKRVDVDEEDITSPGRREVGSPGERALRRRYSNRRIIKPRNLFQAEKNLDKDIIKYLNRLAPVSQVNGFLGTISRDQVILLNRFSITIGTGRKIQLNKQERLLMNQLPEFLRNDLQKRIYEQDIDSTQKEESGDQGSLYYFDEIIDE